MEWQIPFMCLTEEQTSIYFYSFGWHTQKRERCQTETNIKGGKSHWKSIKKTLFFLFKVSFLYIFSATSSKAFFSEKCSLYKTVFTVLVNQPILICLTGHFFVPFLGSICLIQHVETAIVVVTYIKGMVLKLWNRLMVTKRLVLFSQLIRCYFFCFLEERKRSLTQEAVVTFQKLVSQWSNRLLKSKWVKSNRVIQNQSL